MSDHQRAIVKLWRKGKPTWAASMPLLRRDVHRLASRLMLRMDQWLLVEKPPVAFLSTIPSAR